MKPSKMTALVLLCVAGLVIAAGQTGVYREQGGTRMVVGSGASLDVASGGEIDIESGGALKIAGTSVSATAAQLNATAATAGTATASKCAVLGTGKNLDLLVIDTYIDMTPTDSTPSSPSEGFVYWDDSENALKVHNGSDWIALSAGSGDNTLDDAYDQGGAGAGKTITADAGPVTITNTDADSAFLLALTPTPSGSAALGGMSVTVGANSTEDAIALTNAGTGKDIDGTSGTWSVTKAGVGTFADVQATTATVSGALTASTNITLANGGLITNDTNNEIEFEENGEEFSLAFTSDTITLATDTGIDTLDLGVVDDLTGVGSIGFDAAAAQITTVTDGAGQDLSIGISGATNSSVLLVSSGTAADAMQLITTAGGIDVTNGGAATEDTDIVTTNASLNMSAGEDVADAIVINASAGGIDITADGATAKDLDLVCTNGSANLSGGEDAADAVKISAGAGGIDILATGAAAQDIDIVNTGGSVNIEATEADAAAITIESSTDGGGIDIAAQNDIDVVVTNGAAGEDITVSNTGGSVIVESTEDIADSIYLHGTTGGIDILADGAADKDLDLTCTNGSANLSGGEDAADAVVISAGAGGIDISATGEAGQDIDITNTGGSVNVTATEDTAAAVYIRENGGTSGTVKIHADQGEGEASIDILSDAGGITLTAGSGDDILMASDLDVNEDIVGDGGGTISGMLWTVENHTAGDTLTIAEAGTVHTNSGAGEGIVLNLPEASTAIGVRYTFVTVTAQNLDINPDDADQILVLTNAAGDAIRNATAGNTVTLLAIDATNWVVIGEKGTWSDAN